MLTIDDKDNSLPSKFSIGSVVDVNFGNAGSFIGEICGICFTAGEVNYDILVYPFPNENPNIPVILRNVRGFFVEEVHGRYAKSLYPNGYNGKTNVGAHLCNN